MTRENATRQELVWCPSFVELGLEGIRLKVVDFSLQASSEIVLK
jgi:hypothetical protein